MSFCSLVYKPCYYKENRSIYLAQKSTGRWPGCPKMGGLSMKYICFPFFPIHANWEKWLFEIWPRYYNSEVHIWHENGYLVTSYEKENLWHFFFNLWIIFSRKIINMRAFSILADVTAFVLSDKSSTVLQLKKSCLSEFIT